MTPNQRETAHLLVAQPWWKWRPRMALVPRRGGWDTWPVGYLRVDASIVAVDPRPGMGPWGSKGYIDTSLWLPDLADDATGGVLLGVFDAATPKAVHVSIVLGVVEIQWGVSAYVEGDTLAEAAGRALLTLHGVCL